MLNETFSVIFKHRVLSSSLDNGHPSSFLQMAIKKSSLKATVCDKCCWLTCGRICTSMTSCCSSESGSGRPAETVVSPVVFISPLRWMWLLERWLPIGLPPPLGWTLLEWGCWRMLQKSKQSTNICVNPHQIAKSVTNQLPWQLHDGKAPSLIYKNFGLSSSFFKEVKVKKSNFWSFAKQELGVYCCFF